VPASPSQTALASSLRLAVMRLARRMRSERADTSLTLTQLATLATLERRGPLSPRELAAAERVQPPSMTRIAASLEAAGLVTRTDHPTDGRQVLLSVAPDRGRAAARGPPPPGGLAGPAAARAGPGGPRRAAPRHRGARPAGRRVRAAARGAGEGTFRSLRNRNYRLFAGGQVVSLSGTWGQRVAQDWLVLDLSGSSGVALGITTGLQFLPVLLFGLYGGVLADRYDKRRLLLGRQAAMAVLALVLAVLDLTGSVQLWHVYAWPSGWGWPPPWTPRRGRPSSARWSARTTCRTPSA
jgi:DNA-binding MarR family transcriptional regulator